MIINSNHLFNAAMKSKLKKTNEARYAVKIANKEHRWDLKKCLLYQVFALSILTHIQNIR